MRRSPCIRRSVAALRTGPPVRARFSSTAEPRRALSDRREETVITWGKRVLQLTRAGRMSEAEAMVQRMRAQGVAPNSVVFATLIDGWCKAKKPDEALAALNASFQSNQIQNPSIFTSLIGAYCSLGRFDDAFGVIDEMRKLKVAPNAINFTVLLEALTHAGRLAKAEQVVLAMQQCKVDRDARAHAAIVSLYSQIEKEFGVQSRENSDPKALSVSSRLLRWSKRVKEAVNSNNPLLALSMLDTMSEIGVHPNVIVYSTVVSGLARAGEVAKVNELLQRMEREGVSPNEITFVSAIEGLRNAGRHSAAEPLLARLRAEYPASKHYSRLTHFTRPNERATPQLAALSIAIRDLVQQRRMAEADALLAKRQAQGIQPHVVIYNTLISGWAKAGNETQVRDHIERMQAASVAPTEVTRGALVDGTYAPNVAASLLNLLDQKSDRSLESTYAEILRLHAKRGHISAYDRMCSLTSVAPDADTRRHLIAACIHQRLLARAMTEVDALRRENQWLDSEGVSALIKALAKASRLKDANDLLSESRRRGAVPPAVAHASVIFGYAAAGDLANAERVLDEMLEKGPTPTAEAWKPIIYAYAEQGKPELAEERQEAMIGSGLPLDVRAAKAVIESWLRKGDITRAKAAFNALERAGHPPDALSLFALAKAEMRAGRKEEAGAIYARMHSLGMVVPSLEGKF